MNLRVASHARMALCATLLSVTAADAVIAAEAILQDTSLPASGRQETIFGVSGFGRYAMIGKSEQGTALRYINKMAGPSSISGNPGKKDGRIDAFLDVGDYKLVTYADDRGSGEVSLSVRAFTEVNGKVAPQLIEHKLVSDRLNDFEQRSYWINLTERQTVLLEAAGRSLGDLRLWHEGNWLVDLEPHSEIIEPVEGRPLRVKRLSVDLNPGLYLLAAYGGATLPWAETSEEQPFHLRMGIPQLAANGIDRKTTSPFGFDRWMVSDASDYFRLELDENSPASINVAGFSDSYAFDVSGHSAEITRESRLPVAEVFTGKGKKDNFKIVTISTGAGLTYTFQRFAEVRYHVIDEPGTYWVSTLHSGYGEDSADATSLLTDTTQREKYVDSRTIRLRQSIGWQRRFNILDTLTLFFEIERQGDYRVEADDIDGKFRFEPFTTFRGNNYKTPKLRDLGEIWPLDRGFYVLTVIPESDARGVATLSVYQDGKKPEQASPARTSSRYKSVKVTWPQRYRLYLNEQPGVTSGILVRKYPFDLTESMPLTLSPGEQILLKASMPANGELIAQAENGSLVQIKITRPGSGRLVGPEADGNRYPVEHGRYDLALKNNGDRVQNYQLQFTSAEQLASVSLPAFNENLPEQPNFPELTEQQPRYLDLKNRQWASFNVIVDQPGLYKLESTGLLQTRGNIRTRVITRLDQQSSNGVGRNFLIQQYLREGSYQLTLAPESSTAGHLGVRMSKTSLIDGGSIEDGIAARYSLPSGAGLVYRFEIAETDRYRLRSFGTNGYFNARLEDGDGWPLVKPGIKSDMNMELRAGKYRLVVLPAALSTRVVTLLERIEKPVEREGHGPFAIDLNQRSYKHTWLEPIEDQARNPDVWTFELPAPAETGLRLSEGMEATISTVNGDFDARFFTDKKPLGQTLPAGQYRVEVRARRKNNRLDYNLDFFLKELVVGQKREYSAPADIEISTGRESLIELSSFGQNDVKAQLFDADDNLLASNDDRHNDWNFDIIHTLPAGRYRLAVRPVGKSSAQTTIRMAEPKALAATALQLPAELSISNPLIHSYILDLSAQSGVLAVAARSRDSVSLTLEKRNNRGAWSSLATASGSNALLLAAIDNLVAKDNNYRLKIWSPEQRGAEIDIKAGLVETRAVNEAEIEAGLKLTGQSLLSNRLAAVNVELDTPGMYAASTRLTNSIFWAAQKDRQLQPYDGYISGAKKLWLVSLDPAQQLQASRVVLEDQILLLNIVTGVTAWIDSLREKNTDEILIAESRVGLPGIGTIGGDLFDARRMGVGHSSSAVLAKAVTPGSSLRLKVWNTGKGNTVLPVRVRRHSFNPAIAENLKIGTQDAALTRHGALAFKLDGALNDLRFNLPQGAAAVFSKNGKTLRSLWADRSDQTHQVWSDADKLQVFNTTAADHVLNIKLDRTQNRASLARGQMFKRHFPNSGIFSLALSEAGEAGSYAAVYGNRTELLVQNSAGLVARGTRVPTDGDAVISLAHGVGLAAVWINNEQSFIGAGNANKPLPADVMLRGPRQTVDFERSQAGFVSLQSGTPFIARLRRNGLVDSVRVYETGINTSLFLPRGKSQLQLESITSRDLGGVLRLAAVTEVEMAEGLGARVGLLPGDTRVYRFSLKDSQDIGVGVQASIDVTHAYLFNRLGEILGEGVTQKHQLDPGVYYLLVKLPPEAASGVYIKPAIVGLEPPDTGASKEIMLEYQKYSSPETL